MHSPKVGQRRWGSWPRNSSRLTGARAVERVGRQVDLLDEPFFDLDVRPIHRRHLHRPWGAVDAEGLRVDFRHRLAAQQIYEVLDGADGDLAAVHPAREGQDEVGVFQRRQLMNLENFTVDHGYTSSESFSIISRPGEPFNPGRRRPGMLGRRDGAGFNSISGALRTVWNGNGRWAALLDAPRDRGRPRLVASRPSGRLEASPRGRRGVGRPQPPHLVAQAVGAGIRPGGMEAARHSRRAEGDIPIFVASPRKLGQSPCTGSGAGKGGHGQKRSERQV